MVERIAERLILRLMPARAESQDEAPVADLVQAVGHLRQQRGIAERRGGDERAERDAVCDGGERAQEREDFPGAKLLRVWSPEDQVVRQPERVEAELLGALRDGLHILVTRRPPVERAFDQRGHHPQLHSARCLRLRVSHGQHPPSTRLLLCYDATVRRQTVSARVGARESSAWSSPSRWACRARARAPSRASALATTSTSARIACRARLATRRPVSAG